MAARGDVVAVLAVAVEDDVDPAVRVAADALFHGVVILVSPVRVAGLVALYGGDAAGGGAEATLLGELDGSVLGGDAALLLAAGGSSQVGLTI